MILSLLLTALAAHAMGGTVGNGGNVAVCPNSVQMLDKYESETLRQNVTSLGLPTDSVETKLLIAARRLAKVDLQRATVLWLSSLSFLSQARFLRGVELTPVADSDEPFLPVGCHLQQIAVQNKQVSQFDPFYLVNADLWDRLDNDSKAILILHEAIYRASKDQWSSGVVRFLNSFAFSSFLEKNTPQSYFAFIKGTPIASDYFCVFKGPSGRWFFQTPTYENNQIFISGAEALTLTEASASVQAGDPCVGYWGPSARLVNASDAPEMFKWETETMASTLLFQDAFWTFDPPAAPAMVLSYSKPSDGTAHRWCVAASVPNDEHLFAPSLLDKAY